MNALIFLIVLHCTKRRCSQIEPQLKVEIHDEREALLYIFYIYIMYYI